jgi:uncharacterized protein YndB with AHSA1/START domain
MTEASQPAAGPRARARNPVVQAGWKLSLAFVLLIALFVGAGFFLPGTWSAEATRTVAAPPDSVFALLGSPRRWDEWTPWPEIEFNYEGPAQGAGAKRSWDAPQIGAGSFTITAAERPSHVEYVVALAGEAQATRGSFRIEAVDGGTRVTWREEGDYGSNPVMGWAALSMKRRHSSELAARLDALAERATNGTADGASPR